MLLPSKELGIQCHPVQEVTTWNGREPDVLQSHELASNVFVKFKHSECVDH